MTGPRFLVFDVDDVPEEWRDRALRLALVPLLPDEAERFQPEAHHDRAQGDERLLQMVAKGLAPTAIARQLDIPERTIERRLAQLRDRFGARSSAELTAFLAKRGF
ncbi:MAG TPA: LuxR C-terminal-related transcriptional regulator [Actinomycetota bacterium]|nr:LuxR C-terminal-related transcriptional regulator [Actinomycetota bacterium]